MILLCPPIELTVGAEPANGPFNASPKWIPKKQNARTMINRAGVLRTGVLFIVKYELCLMV